MKKINWIPKPRKQQKQGLELTKTAVQAGVALITLGVALKLFSSLNKQ